MKPSGFILLPVVLAMTLIAAIAFLLNRDNGISARTSTAQTDQARARYAAEAGLQAVNAKLQGLSCTGGFPVAATPLTNNNFGGASYSAYANAAAAGTTAGTTATLTSTGTYNGTSVTLTRSNVYVYQAAPVTYTLQPNTASGLDTYIVKNSATNYGTGITLNTNSSSNFPLIKFDLSMFPAGSLPITTTLSLYAGAGSGIGSARLYRILRPWQEGAVNWTTTDGVTNWTTPGGDYHPTSIAQAGAYTNIWMNFGVTDLATSWLSGRYPNHGVLLDMTSGLGSLNFSSSDNTDTVHRPKLTFSYLLPCGVVGPVDPPPVTTVTLSPSADSFNTSSLLNTNNGAATIHKLSNASASENRILTQFNTSTIPTTATVQSATLRLFVSSTTSATANPKYLRANAVTQAWVEGTGNNTLKLCPAITAGTSWSYSTDCTAWPGNLHPPNTTQAWTAMANMPTARTNLMIATVNNKIYAIGGRLATNTFFKLVEEYNPATNTWATKASMPTARSDAAAAVVNGKIYVVGGVNAGNNALSTNEEYDPATNTWASKAAMPAAKMTLAGTTNNGKVYALGGSTSTGTALKSAYAYDPTTNSWATLSNMPTARMYFSAEAINGKIYAVGGWTGSAALNNNEVYDPATNTWSTVAPLPIATDSMGSAVLGSSLYLIGGMQGTTPIKTVRKYDTVNNTYTTLSNYPIAIDMPAAVAVNGLIYAMGGDDGVSVVYPNHNRYTPALPAPDATAFDETTTASPLATGFTSGWVDFDFKAVVQGWVTNPATNKGIVIYSETTDQFSINSRENTTNPPQLIITY
jgi:N-acetylneuraminic acid mutarotase/Tfp pilus assembly protein PilX